MKRPITPQLFLLSALAGWLNREQQRVLDSLREENRVLREQLGPRLANSGEVARRVRLGGLLSFYYRPAA